MQGKLKLFILLIIVMLGSVALTAHAQAKPFTQFRFGTLNPKDVKSGLILGVRTGRDFDNMIMVGFSVDLFWKKYTEESDIVGPGQTGNIDPDLVQLELEYTTMILPLMFTVDVLIPMENSPIRPYFGGGIGYQLLFNKEDNYQEGKTDRRFYSGFGYQLEVGALYEMSTHTGFSLEAFYNGCKAKRDKEVVEGFPVREEVDLSGLGFRIGLTLRGWGF